MLPTSENVQYSVGRVEHTRIQPHRQDTKQPISMYITTVRYFIVEAAPRPPIVQVLSRPAERNCPGPLDSVMPEVCSLSHLSGDFCPVSIL